MTIAFKLFWVTGIDGNSQNDLNGISAEDCNYDHTFEQLREGCGAIVFDGGPMTFYICKQLASPPAENIPTIVYPKRNLVKGDPLYWKRRPSSMTQALLRVIHRLTPLRRQKFSVIPLNWTYPLFSVPTPYPLSRKTGICSS